MKIAGEEGGDLPLTWVGMGIAIIIILPVVVLALRRKS